MRILAVNPWIYDFAAFDLWAKPLGFLFILGCLKDRNLDIEYLDLLDRWHPLFEEVKGYSPKDNSYGCGKFYWEQIPKPEVYKNIPRRYKRYGLPQEVFKKYLKTLKLPDLIMVSSSMTYWYPGVKDTVLILREHFQKTPIIVGGTYLTLCPKHARKTILADYFIEEFIPSSLSSILAKELGINIKIDEDQLSRTTPFYEGYARLSYVVLRLTWGCPFNCNFCGLKKMYKGYFERDHLQVLEEIEYFYKKGVRNFALYDDALLYNHKLITSFLEGIIRKGLKINIHTPNGLHAKYLTKDIACLLKKSNFIIPRVSLESSQEEILKNFDLKVNKEIFNDSISNLRGAGYKSGEYGVYLILGAPGQDLDILKEDIEFCHELGCRIYLADFSYVPGINSEDPGFQEPLLHNNTYLLYKNSRNGKVLQDVKNYAKYLNSLLR